MDTAEAKTSTVEIRTLTAADAAAFWRLRLQGLENDPRAFGESPEEHRRVSVETTAERLPAQENGSFVLGAFDGGELVGVAGFHRMERVKFRHKGAIWGVYVRPEVRGRGIAKRLMSALLDRIRGYKDVDHVLLHVTAGQDAAIRLYASVGFERIGREKRAFKIGADMLDQDQMVLYL
jgi:ribosomal protein S18 acetylase RimI-like enzyme